MLKILHAARNKTETSNITKRWQHNCTFFVTVNNLPIPVAAGSKACVCGCSLAGIADSNPAGGMDIWLF
jgi:hypothetical protein